MNAGVDPVSAGDVLHLSISEPWREEDAKLLLTLTNWRVGVTRLSETSRGMSLLECCRQAEALLWVWHSTGLIGLQAHLMSRPDVWKA